MANSSFENAIKSYLDNRAKTDSLFAETYKKANKTLKECCNYIISQARKIGGSAVAVDDATVFGWAVHYYDEDNLKVESVPEMAKVVPSEPKNVQNELQNVQNEPKSEPKPIQKTSKKKKPEDKLQLSLFDMASYETAF